MLYRQPDLYTKEHDMKINEEKTKAKLFNSATSIDFLPQLTINNHLCLEILQESKLLRVIIKTTLLQPF